MLAAFPADPDELLAEALAHGGVLRVVTDTAEAPYLPGRARLILATRLCGEGLLQPLRLSAQQGTSGEFYYEFKLLAAGLARVRPGDAPSAESPRAAGTVRRRFGPLARRSADSAA